MEEEGGMETEITKRVGAEMQRSRPTVRQNQNQNQKGIYSILTKS